MTEPVKIGVLASGSGSNFEALAKAQARGELGPAAIELVICNKRGAGVLDRAAKHGIAHWVIPHQDFASREEFDLTVADALHAVGVEWVVLAGFMRLLSPQFIRAFPNRIINVHPALLPAFPGAHGVRDAIDYGAKITGVTVHLVDEGVDTGPILLQESEPILPDDTSDSLLDRLHQIEHRLLPQAVRAAAEGRLSVKNRIAKIQPA